MAELVKKYQDFLPAQGVRQLARTALAPRHPVSESDQEYAGPLFLRPVRSKTRHLSKKASYSDFEHGYAANIAPRYLTHSRRSQGRGQHNTRIPAPIMSSTESFAPSRRESPDKGIINGPTQTDFKQGREAPHDAKQFASGPAKYGRVKNPVRGSKEVLLVRPPPITTNKSYRRQSGTGSKVSNIAKHFERINRENERANRRYSVIRGRRARPVASAKAKVEILESVKDVVDESESSESSSEADDEGDGNESPRLIGKHSADSALPEVSEPEAKPNSPPKPAANIVVEPKDPEARPDVILDSRRDSPSESSSPLLPPTPLAPPVPPFTPPGHEDGGSPLPGGIPSLFQTLGLWLQQPQSRHRMEIDMDDLMGNPEHIFRDSSMVVRTDEPTSIIALALK